MRGFAFCVSQAGFEFLRSGAADPLHERSQAKQRSCKASDSLGY